MLNEICNYSNQLGENFFEGYPTLGPSFALSHGQERGHAGMDAPNQALKTIHLRDNAGIRLKDSEYSTQYVLALRAWMREERVPAEELEKRIHFEDELIEGDFISLNFDKFQLGLDFILESIGPREDMEFELGSIRYVPLDPVDQIPKRMRNEQLREWKQERFVTGLGLTPADQNSVSPFGSWTHSGVTDSTLRVFRIPEPPYSDFCRNKPPDLKISHLRALREDGYFDNLDLDVQIAAYLISKGHSDKYQITEFFSHVITWKRFLSAQSKVHHHIQRTWPDRFRRLESAKQTLSKKQLEVFDTRFDVDLAPTLEQTAGALKIVRSALTDRLRLVKRQFHAAFEELWSIIRRPLAWSRECDIQEGGFFRKSSSLLQNCPLIQSDGSKYFVEESKHLNKNIYPFEKCSEIRKTLNRDTYSPELKTVIGSANRGNYEIRRGEYHHHIEERRLIQIWRSIYYLTEYSAEEVSAFTAAILGRENDGRSIFAVRQRLRGVRRRLKSNGVPMGRHARRPIERPCLETGIEVATNKVNDLLVPDSNSPQPVAVVV